MDCGHVNSPRGGCCLCPLCRSHSSCEFTDHHCQTHIIRIYRKCDLGADSSYPSRVSQVEPQTCNTLLQMTCILCVLLAFTFFMGTVGKDDATRDYDADVLLPSNALWFFGFILFWFTWLLLHLFQMLLWVIKGLLWFLSMSVSPLCHFLSFILSCILLLLHYTCDSLYFATFCPVYVYSMFPIVCIALYIITRRNM